MRTRTTTRHLAAGLLVAVVQAAGLAALARPPLSTFEALTVRSLDRVQIVTRDGEYIARITLQVASRAQEPTRFRDAQLTVRLGSASTPGDEFGTARLDDVQIRAPAAGQTAAATEVTLDVHIGETMDPAAMARIVGLVNRIGNPKEPLVLRVAGQANAWVPIGAGWAEAGPCRIQWECRPSLQRAVLIN